MDANLAELDKDAATGNESFYRRCIAAFIEEPIDFVVGGAFGLRHYTGITRNTKDLDLFIRPADTDAALRTLEKAGYKTAVVNAGWLAKAYCGSAFIDIIFRSGNGIAEVDDMWFTRAETVEMFGIKVPVSPVEEVIWSKAFTMERERFDLADIAHLIQAQGRQIDWRHLVARFANNWRVLLAHLVLYGYIYPGQRDAVPTAVMHELVQRLEREGNRPEGPPNICQGTLLSSSQYLVDVLYRGYKDARSLIQTIGRASRHINGMTTEELRAWKHSIEDELAMRLKEAGFIPSRSGGSIPTSS